MSGMAVITIAPVFLTQLPRANGTIVSILHSHRKAVFAQNATSFHKYMNAINNPLLHPLSIKNVSTVARVSLLLR
jgi:hypothetical protein